MKNTILVFCVGLSLFSNRFSYGEIKLLYTAAVIDDKYEMRKIEYIYSLQILRSLDVPIFIVEACTNSSFFDEFSEPVFYSQVNDTTIKNKGVNEARSMKEAFEYYKFDDEDMIVKLSGRYFFNSSHFFNFIKRHPLISAFAKKPNLTSYFTGCFALRAKYFKMFLQELDLSKMENEMICIENELGDFFNRHPEIQIHHLDSLHVTANIFGTGTPMLTYW